MQLRTRLEHGGTPPASQWGIDSEYGRLRQVLVGPIDHFTWQAGNSVAQRSERIGRRFDIAVTRAQYAEMLDAYRQAGVEVHILPASPALPYQLFARDSSGKERVLVPASSKNLIAACRGEGLTVYAPDVSMIGNGGGAVHCMCQALRRDPVAR